VSPPRLAADPALPQRDALLEPDVVAVRLEGRLTPGRSIRVDSCQQRWVKYRIGETLRVVYRIQVEGEAAEVVARAYPDGRSHKAFARALETAESTGQLEPVMHDPELGTVFSVFPNDRKLAQLPALAAASPSLTALFDVDWASSRVAAYVPESSATVACLDHTGEPVGYAKTYADKLGVGVPAAYVVLSEALSTSPEAPRLPGLIGYAPAIRTLVVEPMSGRLLADMCGTELDVGVAALGAALGALHRLPVDGLRPFTRLSPQGAATAAGVIGEARPDVAQVAADLAARLADGWEQAADRPACLHGDVHPKNAIFQEGRLALVDLDGVSGGPPSADLGSFLARLIYARHARSLSRHREEQLARCFLDGYATVRTVPAYWSVRWHTAAALLTERALRSVNRVRPAGLAHLAELLDEGLALASGDRGE